MARWILKCDTCDFEFTHSMITDQSAESYFLPQRPVFTEPNSNVLIAGIKTPTTTATCYTARKLSGGGHNRGNQFGPELRFVEEGCTSVRIRKRS